MSDIAAIAQAAVATFPDVLIPTPLGGLPLPVVMVSIAGEESCGFNAQAAGDCGYDLPACGSCTCGPGTGATSWGAWQIHSIHEDYLRGVTGSSDPCVWSRWLFDPLNCAKAALWLYQGPSGLDNWTTWTSGTWERSLSQAQMAVTAANANGAPTPFTSIIPSLGTWALVGFLALGALLVGVGEIEGWNLLG
jgi:hypothetical protein